MPSIQRQEQIISLLVHQKSVSTAELVDLFQVSEWTVRRDLDKLEAQRLVKRFRGGVRIIEDEIPAIHQSRAIDRNLAIKRRIGTVAVQHLRSKKSIVLSASSTALQVAVALTEIDPRMRVLTNGLEVALALSQSRHIDVISTGGSVDKHFHSLNGTLTEIALREFMPEVAVIGVNGISAEGLSVESPVNAHTLGLMTEQAESVMVVADHTKHNQTAAYCFAPLERVATFVTDHQPDAAFAQKLTEAAVEFVLVPNHVPQ